MTLLSATSLKTAFSRTNVIVPSNTSRFSSGRTRRTIIVRASRESKDRQEATAAPVVDLAEVWSKCTAVARRYDFLSAGIGALAVTTFCVVRGQDPGTALWITAASTVVALLLNDMIDGAD